MKTKIIGTGLSGLVGTRVVELLQNEYDFEDLSLDTGVDITDGNSVAARITDSKAQVVLHLAAIADVDVCERQRGQGKDSLAWKVNVVGTENVVRAVKETGKRLIHISTDFVFSGLEDRYTEESKPNPINWYGETKYTAELIVQKELSDYVIMRLAFPYRAKFNRSDIARFFLSELEKGNSVNAVDDWIVTPTFIDDIAVVVKTFVLNVETGIFHVVGSDSLTPLRMAQTIVDVFRFDKNLVSAVKLGDLFREKAPRPQKLVVGNGKMTQLGVKMKTFREGMEVVRLQLNK